MAIAGATTFSTAASAQWSRDPVCDQQKADACVTTWQALGYWNYEHCVVYTECWECPPLWGYMRGMGPDDAVMPDEGNRPW